MMQQGAALRFGYDQAVAVLDGAYSEALGVLGFKHYAAYRTLQMEVGWRVGQGGLARAGACRRVLPRVRDPAPNSTSAVIEAPKHLCVWQAESCTKALHGLVGSGGLKSALMNLSLGQQASGGWACRCLQCADALPFALPS